ncbi:OTU domain-containing protein 3 isoform X1 [Ananas comosus]|uniref:OTU domain-containing protein 3 isoform X1 n=2 Tax=Ananas comosus TaxID=4615 RepID=A0A6P5FV39_ANACO|nr:OTU domain-containing protein 3 isoform X1 [Ananas comosus]
MVQAKSKKPKPRKPQRDAVKKHGKDANMTEFCAQLDTLGLKIIQVTADGNCFFRALADQLEGNEEEHQKYRAMVVQYIVNHREDFEPFIEDDVPFAEYCESMEKDGTWAGNMELQAASLVTRRNICIHRLNSPRWYINNFSGRDGSMIHLSYHYDEHYNSVRLKEDSCQGPALPINIKADANISRATHNPNIESKRSFHKSPWDVGSVKLVVAGTGCNNIDKVEQVLREVDGDVDTAIEFLIADQQASDGNDTEDKSSKDINHHVDDDKENCDQLEVEIVETNSEKGASTNKKLPRTRACSCGSTKKNKACCGSTTTKSSAAPGKSCAAFPHSKSKGAASKGKKGKIQSKKKETTGEEPLHRSALLPDMGALCI